MKNLKVAGNGEEWRNLATPVGAIPPRPQLITNNIDKIEFRCSRLTHHMISAGLVYFFFNFMPQYRHKIKKKCEPLLL